MLANMFDDRGCRTFGGLCGSVLLGVCLRGSLECGGGFGRRFDLGFPSAFPKLSMVDMTTTRGLLLFVRWLVVVIIIVIVAGWAIHLCSHLLPFSRH